MILWSKLTEKVCILHSIKVVSNPLNYQPDKTKFRYAYSPPESVNLFVLIKLLLNWMSIIYVDYKTRLLVDDLRKTRNSQK